MVFTFNFRANIPSKFVSYGLNTLHNHTIAYFDEVDEVKVLKGKNSDI